MNDTLYNENDQDHKSWADTLGQLQAEVVKGTRTLQTAHAYFGGFELLAIDPSARGEGENFIKKDATGSGKVKGGRSKNRVIVKVDAAGALIEGQAWVWRHDDRFLKLGAGFFKRAKMMRDYIEKL